MSNQNKIDTLIKLHLEELNNFQIISKLEKRNDEIAKSIDSLIEELKINEDLADRLNLTLSEIVNLNN